MRLAVAIVALAVVGCGTDRQSPKRETIIEPSALKLIDYDKLSPEMERLLDLAINHRLIGGSSKRYAEVLAMADEVDERNGRYTFWLPLSETARRSMYDDELVHHPRLLIEVDRSTNLIRRCIVHELCF